MSLFDFPRIHLSGKIDIDVPTINNAVYFPLTMYDQMRSKPFLPPRLYFSTEAVINGVNSPLHLQPIPDAINNYFYVEISVVNTIEILRTWCMTPLGGANSVDKDYIPYYQAAEKDLGANGFPLIGRAPGYWNMWGSMQVKMHDVSFTGIQTFDGNQVNNYTAASTGAPADVAQFFNASFDLDPSPNADVSSACMVETISAQSSFANIYCSNVNLFDKTNPDKVFFSGDPRRFAALIYSAWRVPNWMPPMAGSGRFCGSILFDNLPDAEATELVSFFNKYRGNDMRTIKGVFISFQILEVFENRYDQNIYINHQFKYFSNPALGTTIVTLAPWYEGDMETGLMGRNLVSLNQNNWYMNGGGAKIPVACTPPIAFLTRLANGNAIFSLDMGNSWPEQIIPAYSPTFQPVHPSQVSFETMDVGLFSIRYGTANNQEFASIKINPTDNPLQSVITRGCMFDWLITDQAMISNIANNYISVFQVLSGPVIAQTQILQESALMIASDQKGIYSNEGETESMGFYASSDTRVPCRLRVYQKGVPVTETVTIYKAVYIAPEAGNDAGPPVMFGNSNTTPLQVKDNDVVILSNDPSQPLTKDNNAIYYFVYDQQYPNNSVPLFTNSSGNYTIMDTGSFVVLRVHPFADYSKYIDKSRPDYTPPTFEVVYEEIFKLYDVVYPVMATKIPFTKENWDNGTTAGQVLQRTQMSFWTNILYMPRSRELSKYQLDLITAWADSFNQPTT